MSMMTIRSMVSTNKEEEEMMIKGMSMNEFVEHCVKLGRLNQAREEVIEYTKECIGNHLDNLDDRDLFTLLHDCFDDNLHTMDELDDVFEDFRKNRVEKDNIAEDEVDYDDYEIDLIMEQHENIIDRVEAAYKIYDKAKELFDMALKRDPQELVTVLWNMNQK